ncbi:MAG: CoA-binding protein [Spirochaetota bacterium]
MERKSIDRFFEQKSFAVIGVSRSGAKFGNMVFQELKEKGHSVYQVNANAQEINGDPCFRSMAELPERVEAVVIAVAPEKALSAVQQAHEAGVRHVWLQQGAQSDEAITFGREHGMEIVSGRCFFMFFEPVESIHAFHRFLSKLFGRYPKAVGA